MKQKAGYWYVGFKCNHCERLQAIMEDPGKGSGAIPELAVMEPGQKTVHRVDDKAKVWLPCEDCQGNNLINANRIRRWQTPLAHGRPAPLDAHPAGALAVYKATVIVGAAIHQVDVIPFKSKYWLVPEWIDNPSEGWSRPRRIVDMETLGQFQELPSKPHFIVNYPIPAALLTGDIPEDLRAKHGVVDFPDVSLPYKSGEDEAAP